MDMRETDVAIVGGGLAGGLIALALHRARPELSITVLEAGVQLGGNHRWSWFDSDLDGAAAQLFSAFETLRWNDGYAVIFPDYARRLDTGYNSLASNHFDAGLRRELPDGTVRTDIAVAALDVGGVDLADGSRLPAKAVIDCRGALPSANLQGGWQVFMGRHFRTAQPHGVDRPVIMDAHVEQHGACRFVYTLPVGPNDLFVEDTYYQDDPVLDERSLSARIDSYCETMGWRGETVGGETGLLPVITGGDFGAMQDEARIDGVAMAGARGGFTHPLTSYTVPFAARIALEIAADPDLLDGGLAMRLEKRAAKHWRDTAFYRTLGRMMFGAAPPEERYKVFQHTYRLNSALVERFYAGRSTTADKARLLIGKPPVPIFGAMRALATFGQSLKAGSQS